MPKIKDLANLDQLYKHVTYKEPEPVKTNFMEPATWSPAVADPETRITMRPTVEEIMRQVEAGPVVRNEAGAIVSIGRLRFSDGNNFENVMALGPDGAVVKKKRMPLGAMLGTSEDTDTPMGATPKPKANGYVADLFKMDPPPYKSCTKSKKETRYTKYTANKDEERKALAEAYEASQDAVVTVLPDSLPAGTDDIAACFVGIQMQPKGNGGSMGWEDMCSRLVEKEEHDERLRAVGDDVERLHSASTFADLHDVGSARNRRAVGKRKLRDICYKLGI